MAGRTVNARVDGGATRGALPSGSALGIIEAGAVAGASGVIAGASSAQTGDVMTGPEARTSNKRLVSRFKRFLRKFSRVSISDYSRIVKTENSDSELRIVK